MEPPEGTPPVDSLSHDAAPVAVEAVLRPDPDAREVAKAQAGDMEAFERLVQRNGQRVLTVSPRCQRSAAALPSCGHATTSTRIVVPPTVNSWP